MQHVNKFKLCIAIGLIIACIISLFACGEKDTPKPDNNTNVQEQQNNTNNNQSDNGQNQINNANEGGSEENKEVAWWIKKDISTPTVSDLQNTKIKVINSVYPDGEEITMYHVLKSFTYDEMRTYMQEKISLIDSTSEFHQYEAESADTVHYKDASEFLFGTFRRTLYVTAEDNKDAKTFDEIEVDIENENSAFYDSPNELTISLRNISNGTEQIQTDLYEFLKEIVGDEISNWLIYSSYSNNELSEDLTASDGTNYTFRRNVSFDKDNTVNIRVYIRIRVDTDKRSKVLQNYIPEEYVSLTKQLPYNMSDFVENKVENFTFDNEKFLHEYLYNYGLDGDEWKGFSPDVSAVISSNTRGYSSYELEIENSTVGSNDFKFKYDVDLDKENQITSCKFTVYGCGGNIGSGITQGRDDNATEEEKQYRVESYKKLLTETIRCVQYWYPSLDMSFVDLDSVTADSIHDNSKQLFEKEFPATYLGRDGTLKCSVWCKETAIDTWAARYEIEFYSFYS